jgi:hypothetical protein
VTGADVAGLAGVVLIVIAFAGVTMGRLHAQKPPALLLNLIGAGLVLASLSVNFNLSAFVMEAIWALVALGGLVRIALKR